MKDILDLYNVLKYHVAFLIGKATLTLLERGSIRTKLKCGEAAAGGIRKLKPLSPDLNLTWKQIDVDGAGRAVRCFAFEPDDLYCPLRPLLNRNRVDTLDCALIAKLKLESALPRP